MASLWIRSSRVGSVLGRAMARSRLPLWLKEVPNAGEAQQFLGSHNGVFQTRSFVWVLVQIVSLRVRFLRSEKLGALQMVEILADLPGRKEPLNPGDKRRQLRGERRILLRHQEESEELLADHILQGILTKRLADVSSRRALFD